VTSWCAGLQESWPAFVVCKATACETWLLRGTRQELLELLGADGVSIDCFGICEPHQKDSCFAAKSPFGKNACWMTGLMAISTV
jgi:hypothetical protein